MLAGAYNIVFFRETHSVVVVRFSGAKVNGQRTTVNSQQSLGMRSLSLSKRRELCLRQAQAPCTLFVVSCSEKSCGQSLLSVVCCLLSLIAEGYQKIPSLLLLHRNSIVGGSFYIKSRLCESGIRNSQQTTDNRQQSLNMRSLSLSKRRTLCLRQAQAPYTKSVVR